MGQYKRFFHSYSRKVGSGKGVDLPGWKLSAKAEMLLKRN
jgi:hypothetical protein